MKALLLKNYKELEVVDFPTPEIGPNDLLVRVKACGICGSDVHGYDGGSGRRIPPLVMGHEAAGEVAATGANVKSFREGDRVTFDSTVSCGHCYFCYRGEINLCDNRQVLGVSCGDYRRHGAFAEYVMVPANIAYKLPDSLSYDHAALIEAVSIAVHAVNITPIQLGDTAVVVGTGMIGLLVVQAVRLAGCSRVIAVDLDEGKLAVAKSLGADEGINPKTTDVAARIAELTGGHGAAVAIEAVGATSPIKTAIQSVRKGGTVTLVGNITPSIELPLQSVVTRQIRLQGSCASNGEYPACIDLLASGAIKVDTIISAHITLEEAPKMFERLYAHDPQLMKVVIRP